MGFQVLFWAYLVCCPLLKQGRGVIGRISEAGTRAPCHRQQLRALS